VPDLFGPQTQAHGVFSVAGGEPRVGVRLGDAVLDVSAPPAGTAWRPQTR
jgi:hypothetical protein